jgi:hypothetical protein
MLFVLELLLAGGKNRKIVTAAKRQILKYNG